MSVNPLTLTRIAMTKCELAYSELQTESKSGAKLLLMEAMANIHEALKTLEAEGQESPSFSLAYTVKARRFSRLHAKTGTEGKTPQKRFWKG